ALHDLPQLFHEGSECLREPMIKFHLHLTPPLSGGIINDASNFLLALIYDVAPQDLSAVHLGHCRLHHKDQIVNQGFLPIAAHGKRRVHFFHDTCPLARDDPRILVGIPWLRTSIYVVVGQLHKLTNLPYVCAKDSFLGQHGRNRAIFVRHEPRKYTDGTGRVKHLVA
ncbi:MAG: hypothetical protein ACO4AM_07905, partial [Candidatus Nanopelagicaceae bacterium]